MVRGWVRCWYGIGTGLVRWVVLWAVPHLVGPEFAVQVLAEDGELDEEELDVLFGRLAPALPLLAPRQQARAVDGLVPPDVTELARLPGRRLELLAEDPEVRLVRRQPQHHQVGIGTVEQVLEVRVMVAAHALPADKFHQLVLALARDRRVGEDDGEVGPRRVVAQPVEDVVSLL